MDPMNHNLRIPWIHTLAMVAFLCPEALSGQAGPLLTWHGEIRPRVESRNPVQGTWDQFTSMRTRLGAEVALEGGVNLFFQVQDVRTWGEESSVRDRSADNLDFHQAFLDVAGLPAVGGSIRVGRQEVDIAESRLMGAPNWGQGGQTFDGARWIRPLGDGRMELIVLRTSENSTPAHEESGDFMAAWYEIEGAPGGTAHLYLVHDRLTGNAETSQSSLGGVWKGDLDPFSLTLQGIYQTGTRDGVEVEANLLSAQGQLRVLDGRGSVTLWYDRLSGDGDPEDDLNGAFTTLYGARNRYYGRADYFTDIPVSTGGLGLQDAALKLAWAPRPDISVNLDIHAFHTAEEGPLSSSRLGEEADGWVRIRTRGSLTLQAGYSLTWAGAGMEELGLLRGTGHFGYVMTSVAF